MAKVEFADPKFATGGPIRAQLDHIRRKLAFSQVARHYNKPWLSDETHQLSCHFHGEDKNPSARFYGDTKRIYCFACSKGWDVCGYIKETEGFQTFGQVVGFVKHTFDVWMDPKDLNKRIKHAVDDKRSKDLGLRTAFSEGKVRTVNDVVFNLKKANPAWDKRITALEPMIWKEKANVDSQNVPYVHYCNLVRNWVKWTQGLLKEALSHEA